MKAGKKIINVRKFRFIRCQNKNAAVTVRIKTVMVRKRPSRSGKDRDGPDDQIYIQKIFYVPNPE